MAAFPTYPDEITPGWLAEALGQPAEALGGFTTQPIGTGQMCDSFRLTLDWRDGVEAPATVVAKCPSKDETSRAIAGAMGGYHLEVSWYQTLSKEVPVARPGCYFAEIEDNQVDFLLLLSDLAPARQGDQLAGASHAQIEAAIVQAAALHAPLWRSERLSQIDWLQRDSGPTIRAAFPQLFLQFQDRYANRLGADELAVGARLVEKIDAYLSREAYGRTLSHGDFRIDNLLFSPDNSAAWVVDWQTLAHGIGGNDLAYLIGTSVADPADRAANERRWFDMWVAELAKRGVDADADRLWTDYRIGALSGYVMAVFASMNVERTERGDEMFAVMAERPARQAIALGTLDLL